MIGAKLPQRRFQVVNQRRERPLQRRHPADQHEVLIVGGMPRHHPFGRRPEPPPSPVALDRGADLAADGVSDAKPGLRTAGRRRDPAQTEGGPDAGVRVGFTVSRKVGSAVQRNRARRRLKAAAERVMPLHADDGHEFVLIGRVATLKRPFAALVGDLETALRKLNAYHD